MKIAFWGLGSIAKRHIRNLSEILNEKGIDYQIDVYRHEYKEIEEKDLCELVTGLYCEEQLGDKQYDIIFITNPTALHLDAVTRCAHNTRHMFIEKPVFDKCDVDVEDLPIKAEGVYYVACPLRYTLPLQYIKEHINRNTIYSIQAISSSYLPDWRTGTDYRNTYSAHKDLGGGVAIDLIHEWDYLTALFGMPKKVLYAGGKFSHLEIDSDDLATYIGIYDDKLIELHLDYFGRKTTRELTLYTQDEVIVADVTNGKILYKHAGTEIALQESRDDYQKRELMHFMDIIEGKCENDNSIENALKVLRIAQNYTGEDG